MDNSTWPLFRQREKLGRKGKGGGKVVRNKDRDGFQFGSYLRRERCSRIVVPYLTDAPMCDIWTNLQPNHMFYPTLLGELVQIEMS